LKVGKGLANFGATDQRQKMLSNNYVSTCWRAMVQSHLQAEVMAKSKGGYARMVF
jgi:hypothetical protein